MLRSLPTAFLMIVGAVAGYSAERVFRIAGQGVVEEAVVVPRSQFTPRLARELSLRFLSRNPKAFFGKFSVYVDKADALLTKGGKGTDHYTYHYWASTYGQRVSGPFPTAELLAFGSSAVLRWFDQEKRTGRAVLKGEDHLRFVLDGAKCEVVHIHMHLLDPLLGGGVMPPWIEAYTVTDGGLQPRLGTQVLKRMRRLLGPHRMSLSVSLAHDSWFIDDASFPVRLRLSPPGRPPSYEEYLKRSYIRCFEKTALPGNPPCVTVTPDPRGGSFWKPTGSRK
jgi:hypothetical protein